MGHSRDSQRRLTCQAEATKLHCLWLNSPLDDVCYVNVLFPYIDASRVEDIGMMKETMVTQSFDENIVILFILRGRRAHYLC